MTLEIIGVAFSNFVRTVRMVAHEKGVPYELNPLMPRSDEIRAINPLGQVPAMRHDDLLISESQAIARYIDTAFDGPPLMPRDPRAAAPVDQWICRVNIAVDQLLMRQYVVEYAFHKDEEGNVVRTTIDRAIKRFPRMFAMLDEGVAPGCLGSEDFTMADCFLMPILAATARYPEGKEGLEGAPRLKAYFDRLSERPSFVETAR